MAGLLQQLQRGIEPEARSASSIGKGVDGDGLGVDGVGCAAIAEKV